jgi:hypothetical protein
MVLSLPIIHLTYPPFKITTPSSLDLGNKLVLCPTSNYSLLASLSLQDNPAWPNNIVS